jgi:hypothetical protein
MNINNPATMFKRPLYRANVERAIIRCKMSTMFKRVVSKYGGYLLELQGDGNNFIGVAEDLSRELSLANTPLDFITKLQRWGD